MKRLLFWRAAVVTMVFALWGGMAAGRGAQAQIPGGIRPDVQVIVVPLPTGQWGVSTVYPKQVGKAEADTRLARLLDTSHWKASEVSFENGQLKRKYEINDPDVRPTQPAPPVMSSLTFSTSDNPLDLAAGTMVLEPFVQSFRDLSRVHITYLVPKGFVFHGLRHFENSDLSVDMMGGGEGAYTYVLNIKNHRLPNFTLPKTDPLSPALASGQRNGATWKQQRLVGGSLVVIIALIAGGLVYLWAQKMGGPSRRA